MEYFVKRKGTIWITGVSNLFGTKMARVCLYSENCYSLVLEAVAKVKGGIILILQGKDISKFVTFHKNLFYI